MNLTDIKTKTDIPNNLSAVQDMLWLAILQAERLKEQLALLRKETFGQKSEKLKDDIQLVIEGLFEQIPDVAATSNITEFEYVEVKATHRRKKHPGRNAIPADIKTEYHVLDVEDHIKNCVDCPNKNNGTCNHTELPKIQEVFRTVIERKKAEYVKHLYVRIKRACPTKKDIVHVAEPPFVTPIDKGLAGIQLLLFVILSKYQFHQPLYRIQRQIYHESRLWFTRATMVGWISKICVLLKPLYTAMADSVKKSPVIWSDDTLIRLATRDNGAHTSYMWVYLGQSGRNIIFDYRNSRSSAAPREFLNGVAPGTYFMTDACASYNDAITRYKLIEMACMMHIRREFIEAAQVGSKKDYALKILRLIGQLYRIERYATNKQMSEQQRLELRTKYSVPVMAKIKDLLINRDFALTPDSRISKAINYALKLWIPASVFLTRGDLPIDNGASERAIRDLVIGRKNWLFVASAEGGTRMAILLSIISTCKVNGIDIEEYLSDILMKLASRAKGQSVADLTPLEWLKAKNNGTLPEARSLYPSKN